MTIRAGWLVCALALTGCPSFLTMRRAGVLPDGAGEFGVHPVAVQGTGAGFGDVDGFYPVVVNLATSYRRGIGSNLELGGRVWVAGAAAEFTWQFHDSQRLVASSGASVAILATAYNGLAVDVSVPILFGVNFGAHQLVLGPKLYGRFWRLGWFGQPRGPIRFTPLPGAVAAFSVAVTDGLTIMPEFNLHYWFEGRTVVFQGGVGIYF